VLKNTGSKGKKKNVPGKKEEREPKKKEQGKKFGARGRS